MKIKPIKDIAAATDAELSAWFADAGAEFAEYEKLSGEGTATADDTDAALAVAAAAGQVREELDKRAAALAESASKIQAAGSIFGSAPAAPAAEAPAAEQAPAAAAAAGTIPDAAPVAAANVDFAALFAGLGETLSATIEKMAPAAVIETPAAPASLLANAAAVGFPAHIAPSRNTGVPVLTASAGLPDIDMGTKLDGMDGLVKAVTSRLGSMSNLGEGNRQQFAVATIHREFPDELTFHRDLRSGSVLEVIERAANERRLAKPLTAAGGWCSPSEQSYGFCENETVDGVLSIAEVDASRGGLSFTMGPDASVAFADLNSVGFVQTEAQAIAGQTKPFSEIACPEFEEIRLDAVGWGLRAPLLTRATYPELIERYIRLNTTVHVHRVNQATIASIVAGLGTPIVMQNLFSTVGSALAGVEYLVQREREKYCLSKTATMEAIAPTWLLPAMRADLSMRTGIDLLAVTDAQINAWFAQRGINIQWVYDWQMLQNDAGEDGYPATVDIAIYPAGAFVRAQTDVIKLDTIYDHASLAVNMYTALFMEEGMKVFRACRGGSIARVPVFSSGRTGIANVSLSYITTDAP